MTTERLTRPELERIGEAWGNDRPPRDFASCDTRDFARSTIGRRCPRRGQWLRVTRAEKVLHVFRCDRHKPELPEPWTVQRLGPTPAHVTERARMIAAAMFPHQHDRARWSEALRRGRLARDYA